MDTQKAELAKLAWSELESYENSLKAYRDLKSVIDTARDEGRDEGRVEGRVEGRIEGRRQRETEMALQLKNSGVSVEIIAKTTGLSEKEISDL